MRFFAVSLVFAPLIFSLRLPGSVERAVQRREISQSLYDDLVYYLKYSSVAYLEPCDSPNGASLASVIDEPITDTQGYIAVDDAREEIVVVFRGTTSTIDFEIDFMQDLVDFISPGVNAPNGTQVHEGFLKSWIAVAETVISAVRSELAAHPGYDLVTTGHSLGGSVASLGGISLQENFPDLPVRMYTYGQPRTGNANYAAFVNAQMGSRVFRNVHTTDGVPTTISTSLGYAHHGVEYWQSPDPPSPSTVNVCDPAGEDATCSASIPTGGINEAHGIYFGIPLGTSFCA